MISKSCNASTLASMADDIRALAGGVVAGDRNHVKGPKPGLRVIAKPDEILQRAL
ncbi:MAG: hypothetical protein LH481_14345 [Burkholderiales bacterium]|nr:hypothetical protein [Burkholderiales bacterium]